MTINKIDATFTVSGYSGVYTGTAHPATVGAITGINSESGATVGSFSSNPGITNVPGGSVPWTFTGGTNYNNASGNATITITKATATVTVIPYSNLYDGLSHTVSATLAGVNSETGATVGTFNPGTSYKNVPGGAAHWTFTSTNYEGQEGDSTVTITKAAATVSVTPYTGTYDGNTHFVSATLTGVNGETGATVGTFDPGMGYKDVPGGAPHWTFTSTNYVNQSGDSTVTINKADPTLNITTYSGAYTGTAHGLSATITGVNSESGATVGTFNPGSSFTNVPGGTANWTFTAADIGGGIKNYNDKSGSRAITMTKADAVLTITTYNGPFTTTPHSLSATIAGVNGETGATVGTFNPGASFTDAPGGTANWTFTATDIGGGIKNYNDQSGSKLITITAVNSALSFSVSPVAGQTYSDKVQFSSTASGTDQGGILRFYINFGLATQQQLGSDIVVGAAGGAFTPSIALLETVTNALAPGNHNLTARFLPAGPNYIFSEQTIANYPITKEDANATYSGQYAIYTPGTTTYSVNVPLTFTIQDSNLLPLGDPLYDADPGDVQRGKFSIVVQGNSNPQCLNLAPVLVNAADKRTGTIGCTVTLTVPSANGNTSANFTISVTDATGSYYKSSAGDNAFDITVSLPGQTSFLNGGGFLVNTASSGQYSGTSGKKTNFGFNVKYNKTGKNLQGEANIIVRSGGRIYQIKGNAMQSLGVTPTAVGGTGNFVTKANLTDITDPLNPIAGPGNLAVTVTFLDAGEPGSTDKIGISVYNSGALLFGSNWDGTKIVDQLLGGGNLSVK